MAPPVLVHEYLTLSGKFHPRREALICGRERLTYEAVDMASNILASALPRLGVERHDRVLIFLDNCTEAVISFYGILKAGAVAVPLNPSMKAGKLRYILTDSGARVVITHTNKRGVAADAMQDLENEHAVIWIGQDSPVGTSRGLRSWAWDGIFAQIAEGKPGARQTDFNCPGCSELDLAVLIYTSGSTGEPKGVMCPHCNMVSAAQSILQVLGTRGDDIILNVLPLSFDYGLYQVIMAFMCGATLVLEKSFLYPRRTMDLIEQEQVTVFPIVPSIAAILLQRQDLKSCNLSSLRAMTSTAAPLPVEHLRRIREYLPHIRFFSMYGLTECKRVSCLPPEELDARPTSVGIPIPGCQVFIVDEEGNEVAPGQVGELVVRGPNVMKGYWNAPELSARTFRQGTIPGERCLYSGDLFRRDPEGFLYFVARKDDLIKSRGERVSPKEVENTLCAIDGVVEAAVVGVPDDILGQAVAAFVVRVSDSGITEKAILKYCADHLESFMVPRYVRFVNALPRAATGKIDRKSVQGLFQESSKP